MSLIEPVAVFCLALIAVAVGWLIRSETEERDSGLPPDRSDLIYSAFTKEFDIECASHELSEALIRNAVDARAPARFGNPDIDDRRSEFTVSYHSALKGCERLKIAASDDMAVAILLDQSGSMAPRMPAVAGELLAATEILERAGAQVLLAGFTTVGWRGGRSRKNWFKSGRPEYPGRLCDLLHVVYSPFEETTETIDLEPLLLTNVCFENVDGEALRWGELMLADARAKQKFMIVISDGAPVDDSTLQENGPSFLWNHLEEQVQRIVSETSIKLGAVGVNHGVDKLYANSRMVEQTDGLAAAVVNLVEELSDGDCD